MDAGTKAKLRNELLTLQGMQLAAGGYIHAISTRPIQTPSGPVAIPALRFIADFLKLDLDINQRSLKLVEQLLDAS